MQISWQKAGANRMRGVPWSALATFAVVFGPVFNSQSAAEILSAKRGFADTGANYSNLQATGAGWYYTWGTGTGSPGNFDAKHYPMFWNAPSQNTINNVKNRNPEWALGFNEPERPDQANMSVAQAIASWTTISNSFAGTSTNLASPAVSDTGDGQAWLASFMQQAAANNLRIDAVAFHWYGVSNPNNPAGAASSFLSRVDSYHNQYNKPVFITEFAIHDWGGAYSDAEIIEANRQFLNIVIPALESRSYVAGYAWYHWFSDARLYDGSPPTPTPMGYSYVGAVAPGQLEDISGQNFGEHVAYLTGGELTKIGAAAGSLKFINALAGTSTISGTSDWALAGNNWVRIQPNATLRKVGANEISFSGGAMTNHGVLEVAEGRLRLGSSMAGNGSFRIKGIGTLNVTGLGRALSLVNGQTLDIARGGKVEGGVNALAGSVVAGGGEFGGSVTAQSGSTVRVGQGPAGAASRFAIDNFESYAPGDVRSNASPPWTAHQNTSLADIENFGGNKVLTFGWASDFRGVSRTLPEAAAIENDSMSTFFFRFNSKTDDPDHSIGLGDQATTGGVDFNDFEAQLRMKQGTSAGTFALDARSGGAFSPTLASGLSLNTWYNMWMVVDQAADTYDLYLNTGTGAASAANKLNGLPLAFRNGTTSDLNTILGLAGSAPIDNGVRIDEVFLFRGFDLTNPLAGFDPGLVWSAETLTVDGNYTQAPAATLEIDLGGTAEGQFDVLDVGGTATLNGNLQISFANGFAPSPADLFPILEAAETSGTSTLSGASEGFWLLPTPTGRSLYFGDLPVGDYDRNGVVDSMDYDRWQAEFGAGGTASADGNGDGLVDAADYIVWRRNLGATVFADGAAGARQTVAARVPEPSLALVVSWGVLLCAATRPFRRAWAGLPNFSGSPH